MKQVDHPLGLRSLDLLHGHSVMVTTAARTLSPSAGLGLLSALQAPHSVAGALMQRV